MQLTAGTIGVEDTGDANVNAILSLEPVCEGFSNTLTLVVTSTRTDGVDMSPAKNKKKKRVSRGRKDVIEGYELFFVLRVDLGITVDLYILHKSLCHSNKIM